VVNIVSSRLVPYAGGGVDCFLVGMGHNQTVWAEVVWPGEVLETYWKNDPRGNPAERFLWVVDRGTGEIR
jgi:hypothetical protein